MNEFVIFIICVVILIVNVYFTRWVFRIDELIETQKEQAKLLKIISEKIQRNTNVTFETQNSEKLNSPKFTFDKNVCPACQNPLYEFDKKCSNCGLVITE